MNSCPNYSDPKFKKIIEALGGDPIKATQYYHNYDGDVDLLYQDLVIDAQAGTTDMVKPRAAEVFASSPELSEIGTPDQYSRYLDSIFPDSSVKDIFILSTPFNLIKDTSKGIQSQLAKYKKFKGFMVEPSNMGHPYGPDSLYKDYKVIINPQGKLVTKLGKTGYVITSEARIHVLGSKSDVEGFRDFVKGDTDLGTTKRYEKTGPQTDMFSKTSIDEAVSTTDKNLQEDVAKLIEHINQRSSGLDMEVINDPLQQWKGRIVNGITPTINLAYAGLDTPFHEMSHPFLGYLRIAKPGKFNALYEELMQTAEFEKIRDEALSKVETDYPEYSVGTSDFKDEVLATAIGYAAKNKVSSKLKRLIKKILKALADLFGINYNQKKKVELSNADITLKQFIEYITDPDIELVYPAKFDLTELNSDPLLDDINNIISNDQEQSTLIAESLRQQSSDIMGYDPNMAEVEEEDYSAQRFVDEEVERAIQGLDDSTMENIERSAINIVKEVELSPEEKERLESELQQVIQSFRNNYQNVELPFNLKGLLKLPKREFKPRVEKKYMSDTELQEAAVEGDKVKLSSKFLKHLQKNATGQTMLNKPFKIDGLTEYEQQVLELFRMKVIDDVKAWSQSNNMKAPERIDNKRLAEKLEKFIYENYPWQTFDTPFQNYTYHIKSAITSVLDDTDVGGYEVMIYNGFLSDRGHTYDLNKLNRVDENTAPKNTLGWFIYYKLGEKTFVYELQSDFVDGDAEVYATQANSKAKAARLALEKILNINVNEDRIVTKIKGYESLLKEMPKLRQKLTEEIANDPYISLLDARFTPKQINIIKKILKGRDDQKLVKNLKKFMGTDYIPLPKGDSWGAILGRIEKYENKLKEGITILDPYAKRPRGTSKLEFGRWARKNTLTERQIDQKIEKLKYQLERNRAIKNNPKAKKYINDFFNATEARYQLYFMKNGTANAKAMRVVKDTNALKTSWFAKSLMTSILYAKGRGDNVIYLPTAEFMENIGDASSPYATPYDVQRTGDKTDISTIPLGQYRSLKTESKAALELQKIIAEDNNTDLKYMSGGISYEIESQDHFLMYKADDPFRVLRINVIEYGSDGKPVIKKLDSVPATPEAWKNAIGETTVIGIYMHGKEYYVKYDPSNPAFVEAFLDLYNNRITNNVQGYEGTGGVWNALKKIKGIDYEITDIPELKHKVIKVDLTNFNEDSLDRFSKLDSKMSQFKKLVKLTRKEVSGLQRAMVNKRIKAANAELGTSYYIVWQQVGQADLYRYEIVDSKQAKVKDEQTQSQKPTSGESQGQQMALFYAAPVNDPTLDDAESLTGLFAKLNADATQSLNNMATRNTHANTVVERIIERLSGQLGNVPYEFITVEQAADMLSNSATPYNNQPAFNYNGRVYFIKDRINDLIAFHEFSHPFIAALRTYNKSLYDKLVKGLLATDEGKMIYQKVLESHPHLKPGTDMFNDEIMVTALSTRMNYKRMGIDNSTGFMGWLKDILYQIKRYLREMFGKKINISKLDESTTLQDLATMLEKGGMFDVKDVEVTDEDAAAFYAMGKEVIEDLKKVSPNEQTALLNRIFTVVSNHLRLMENNQQYSQLLNLLQDKYGENEFEEIKKNISRFTGNIKTKLNDAVEEMKFNNAKAAAMLDSLNRMDVVLKRFNEHLDDLTSDLNSKDNALTAFQYRTFVDHYAAFVSEMKESMEDKIPSNSPLRGLVNSLETHIDDIIRKSQKFSSAAASTILYEQLGMMAEQIDKKYTTIIDTITKNAIAKGRDPKAARNYWFKEWKGMTEDEFAEYEQLKATKATQGYLGVDLENRLIKLQNQLFDGTQITKEKIDLALKGIGPDANAFSSFLEGYLYNPDPVIGSFALYIKNNMTDVLLTAQSKMNEFFIDVMKDLEAAGYKPNAVEEFADKILRLQTIGRFNDAGQFEEKEVWSMLSDHKDYRIARDKLNNDINVAQKEFTLSGGSKEAETKLAMARKALEDLERKYFHNTYHPIFYERYDMFDNNNPLHVEAWRRYKDALEEIDNFNKETYSEDIFMDTRDAREMAFKRYKDLFSMYKDGKPKEGDELAITMLLIKFRKESQKFWDWKSRPGSFMKALHRYQQSLIDQGIPKTDPMHAQKVQAWIDANTTVKIKGSWYEQRQILITRYKQIMSKLNQDERLKMDQSNIFETILNICYPHRNQDGHVNGRDMNQNERDTIRKMELELIEIRKKLKTSSGFSDAEADDFEYLSNVLRDYMKTGKTLTDDERMRYQSYTNRLYNNPKLTQFDKDELEAISKELGEMTSRIPTQDYIDELNDALDEPKIQEVLQKYGLPLEYGIYTLYKLLGEGLSVNPILTEIKSVSPKFKKWYDDNHITTERWEKVPGGKPMKKSYDQRLFIWNITMPSDDMYLEKMQVEEIDGQKYEINKVPSVRFSQRVVKDYYEEFDKDGNITKRVKLKTDKIIGVTKDNQGEWLPRMDVPNSPFIDERFQQLKNSTDPKDKAVFKALEKLKANHLKNQEGLSNRSKLYLDIPRYRKDNLEAIRTRDRVKRMKKAATNMPPEDEKNRKGGFLQLIIDRVREFFYGSGAEAELDGTGAQLNFDDQMLLVRTDIFDNELSKMPISGLSNIDYNDVSLDVPKALMRYMLGAERQKKLIDINPMAIMVKETVQMNSPKDSNRFSKWHMQKAGVLKRINTKSNAQKKRAEKDISVREKAITALYDREFLGQFNTGFGQDKPWIQNFANFLFKRASFGFFALNIGSALKNAIGPKIQGAIMSAGGEYMTGKTYAQGEKWSFNTMFELSFGLYKAEPGSLNVQLMEIMDIIPDRLQNKFGERISRTLTRDVANMGWLYNFRKWTESQSTLALGGAMMSKQMVDTLDGSKMSFMDAWQIVNGKIQLKSNVDPSWGITYDKDGNMKVGDKFKYFRNRLQQAGTLLQGSYGEFEQPEAQRYLAWRFISYMRRYFTSMFINRVGFKGAWNKPTEWKPRHNYGLGDVHMGYYASVIRTLARAFKDRQYLSDLTPQEKSDIYKFLTEVGILVALMALLGPLFGWDPDDEDKYEKLKKKSGALPLPGVAEDPKYPFHMGGWLENQAMLLMMQVRAENEQFIPWPNFGLDDYVGLLNLKSVAMDPTIKVFEDALTAIYNAGMGNDAAYYKRTVGPYDFQQEGSWKIWNYILKSFGLTGSQIEPVKGMKDLISVRTK